jgi:ketosteroid isomerase-like protein
MSHHVTHDSVQRWLDDYARAWETYDPAQIGALFSEDAEYRWHPFDEDPAVGRDAIVKAWISPNGDQSSRDAEGTYRGEYRPWAVEGNRAVAIGTSTYWSDASRSKVERVYYNNWLLEFAPDGTCSSFVEYYNKQG